MRDACTAITTRLRKALAGAIVLGAGLAACSYLPDEPHYPLKGDAKPHPGVERALKHPIQGIDISRWQGQIDWSAVQRAGTAFVFIKASEGGDHMDPNFRANWEGARAAGIPRGAYHFVYWCRPAEEQAAWFRQNVPNDPDALPPVLDVEWNGHSRTCPKKIDPEAARGKIAILLAAMEAHTGKKPIIYTDIPFHAEVLEGRSYPNPFWLRSVAAEPDTRYNGRMWMFWQFTTTGRVPGIQGAVDRNAFAGTRDDWEAFLRANRVIR